MTVEDKKDLLSGGWLSDTVIVAAQNLIKAKYPSVRGLQDVTLGQSLAFNVIHEEFVQILHTG